MQVTEPLPVYRNIIKRLGLLLILGLLASCNQMTPGYVMPPEYDPLPSATTVITPSLQQSSKTFTPAPLPVMTTTPLGGRPQAASQTAVPVTATLLPSPLAPSPATLTPTGSAPATAAPTGTTPATAAPTTPAPATAVPASPTAGLATLPAAAQGLPPERWQEWPVLPALSARARQVLRSGQALGANPRAFSKVGDCETITDWFLVDFDRGARYYNLGAYADLQWTVDYFSGSFQRKSLASARGFTAASALSPIWADPAVCQTGETPLACEYRLQRPALAFIMLGTNDTNNKATFEANLRKVLDFTLERGVLPVLVTKADNLEGDNRLNAIMAQLAYEYDLPLWNYWLAVQPLPFRGLQADGAHLTYAPNRFDLPDTLLSAWPVRNLTALQVLDILRQAYK